MISEAYENLSLSWCKIITEFIERNLINKIPAATLFKNTARQQYM